MLDVVAIGLCALSLTLCYLAMCNSRKTLIPKTIVFTNVCGHWMDLSKVRLSSGWTVVKRGD